jgi:hypothetical protein
MRRILLCALGTAVIACGGGGSGSASQPSTVSRQIRGPADVISEAEINAGVYQTALEIVQNLRPNMTRPRGSTAQGPVPVVLFVDDVRMGELNGMANIPASRVKEIRYISARDATTRWGTGVGSGVILVTTKR